MDVAQKDTKVSIETVADVVRSAEALVQAHFQKIGDPSHDWHHVHRVRLLALWLSRCPSLGPNTGADAIFERSRPDMLVLELSALFHDMCDRKLLDPGHSGPISARVVLESWLASVPKDLLSQDQITDIVDIVDNVSWSKDEARRQELRYKEEERRAASGSRTQGRGAESAMADVTAALDDADLVEKDLYAPLYRQRPFNLPEYACVSDADRLDSIGSIGALRCAAFSARVSRPLFVGPPPVSAGLPPNEVGPGYSDSAIAHFRTKLLRIKATRLFTERAREEADRRQSMLTSLLAELDLEWLVCSQGESLSLAMDPLDENAGTDSDGETEQRP